MKTYEIKYEPVELPSGEIKDKYNIYYYFEDGSLENKEQYIGNVLTGYSIRTDSMSISDYKKYIIELIDKRCQEKIFEGFTFDSKIFSLSISAQINWSNLLLLPQAFFPINLSTKDDDIYILTYENVQLFYGAALMGKNTPLQEGNILKQQVKSAITKEELDVIKNSL